MQVRYPKWAVAENRNIYLACGLLMVAILALDFQVPLGVAVVIFYNAVVLVALRSNKRGFIVATCVIASLFTILPLFNKEPIDGMWKVVCNRTLALFSIWIECYLGLQRLAVDERREKALGEREKALQEVRVLRGFLPICASCKKIRDLEGSWTMIERYVSEHSDAEFSHGLCPDCSRKLFPHLFPQHHDPDRTD